jgi:hypothetical protein
MWRAPGIPGPSTYKTRPYRWFPPCRIRCDAPPKFYRRRSRADLADAHPWPGVPRDEGSPHHPARRPRPMRRTRRRACSCGNEPHGDRPGGFFLCRRRRAGFSVDEVADPRGWFVKRLAGSGVVQGLYQGWFTPLGHSVRGCFVIRFPARRRLDDRKHAISGVFRPIPSDRPSLCPSVDRAVSLAHAEPGFRRRAHPPSAIRGQNFTRS